MIPICTPDPEFFRTQADSLTRQAVRIHGIKTEEVALVLINCGSGGHGWIRLKDGTELPITPHRSP